MNTKRENLVSTKTNIFTKGVEIRASSIDIDSLPIHKKPKQVRDEIPTLNSASFELKNHNSCRLHIQH